MGDNFERRDSYKADEAFDAIHAAGMSPAEFPGELEDGSPLEGRHGAGAPPLVSYGASSTLLSEPGSDAIPTSVMAPAGAESAIPVPEPSPAPQELGSPHPAEAAEEKRRAKRGQRTQSNERERQPHMDRWEDSATGAMATDEARAAGAAASSASGVAPGAAAGVTGATASESAPQVSEWRVEVEEEQAPPTAARIALIAGAAALAGLAIAGGVTWLIIQRRRINAAREMERAIAASRLLRMTPAAARPHMLEAIQARGSATQLAQQSAAETARMARALRQAANVSASTARDFATERTSTAQELLGGALNTAIGGANTAWRTVSKSAPGQTQWLARAFNAGRYAGRVEQRLK